MALQGPPAFAQQQQQQQPEFLVKKLKPVSASPLPIEKKEETSPPIAFPKLRSVSPNSPSSPQLSTTAGSASTQPQSQPQSAPLNSSIKTPATSPKRNPSNKTKTNNS
jgi:hypothetical protein